MGVLPPPGFRWGSPQQPQDHFRSLRESPRAASETPQMASRGPSSALRGPRRFTKGSKRGSKVFRERPQPAKSPKSIVCFSSFGVFGFLATHDFQDVLEGSKIAHDDSHTGSKAPKSAPKGHRSPRWPKRAPRRRQDSPRQPEGPKTPRDGPRLSRGLQKTPKTAPGGPKRAHRRYWRVPKRFKRP